MDDEVLAALVAVRDKPKRMDGIWADYPCDRCERCGYNCSGYAECPAWLGWFRKAWRGEVERLCRKKHR